MGFIGGFVLLAAVWNTAVFLLYGFDKRAAEKGRWRISEGALLSCALLMGSIGAFLGMRIFKHKTKHWKFMICVPASLALHIVLVIGAFFNPLLR